LDGKTRSSFGDAAANVLGVASRTFPLKSTRAIFTSPSVASGHTATQFDAEQATS